MTKLDKARAALATRRAENAKLGPLNDAVAAAAPGSPAHYVAVNALRAAMGLSRMSEADFAVFTAV